VSALLPPIKRRRRRFCLRALRRMRDGRRGLASRPMSFAGATRRHGRLHGRWSSWRCGATSGPRFAARRNAGRPVRSSMRATGAAVRGNRYHRARAAATTGRAQRRCNRVFRCRNRLVRRSARRPAAVRSRALPAQRQSSLLPGCLSAVGQGRAVAPARPRPSGASVVRSAVISREGAQKRLGGPERGFPPFTMVRRLELGVQVPSRVWRRGSGMSQWRVERNLSASGVPDARPAVE
jgi:hypothetical protein